MRAAGAAGSAGPATSSRASALAGTQPVLKIVGAVAGRHGDSSGADGVDHPIGLPPEREAHQGFRKAWHNACRKAGLAGRIPYDLRRTAFRNPDRAGVPRRVAMKMVGHKTESTYRRYAIVDESMLREAADKLARAQRAKSTDSDDVLHAQGIERTGGQGRD